MFGNYYGYVATVFHPYIVGCWGPGTKASGLSASCSKNARKCVVAGSSGSFMTVSYMVVASLLSLFLAF